MANTLTNKSPWNELDYYKEGQTIYGRDEEIWKVTNGICQNLQTVLYGQSGIGKSSLLFAGVFPRLRKEQYFPIFIRLGMSADSSYIKTVINAILTEADRTDSTIGKAKINCKTLTELNNPIEEDSAWLLWSFISCTKFTDEGGNPYIPVLVFDQFEEILNNSETHNKAEQFLLDIYSLLDDTRIMPEECVPYSNFRIVISLREDYLYCLEDIIDKYNLNELRYNRFRIASMTEKCAKEVIMHTSRDVGGCLENGKENAICDRIIQESKNYMGEVNTLMLSLICSTQYMNADNGIIKYSSLLKNSDHLYHYYSNKMREVDYSTKDYLEKKLITSDGRRSSVDLRDAIDSGKVSYDTINSLIEIRLLRLVVSGDNSKRIELIHDKLASIINDKKRSSWQSFIHACKNINNFSGRADRQEWLASFSPIIIWAVIAIVPPFIAYICFVSSSTSPHLDFFVYEAICWFVFLFGIALCFPASVRRCHDMGKSGWSLLKNLINLPFKPSSNIPYREESSSISWKRLLVGKSITHLEYRGLTALISYYFTLTMVFLWAILVLVVLISVKNGYDMHNSIIFISFVSVLGTIFLSLIVYSILISTVYIFRLSSIHVPLVLALIPISQWYYGLKSFFPFTKEEQKEINTGKAFVLASIFNPFLIGLLSIILPIILLLILI